MVSEEGFEEAVKKAFDEKVDWEQAGTVKVRISPKLDQIKIEMRFDG